METIILLIADCEEEIKYWEGQPESEEKTKNIETFTRLIAEHKQRINEIVKRNSRNAEFELKDIFEKAKSFIAFFGKILEAFPDKFGDDVKKLYKMMVKVVDIVGGLLEWIKKI